MQNKCIICDKLLSVKDIYICETHTSELLNIVNNQKQYSDIIIEHPSFMDHCMICGEWEARKIINYPSWNYICNICLNAAQNIYKL